MSTLCFKSTPRLPSIFSLYKSLHLNTSPTWGFRQHTLRALCISPIGECNMPSTPGWAARAREKIVFWCEFGKPREHARFLAASEMPLLEQNHHPGGDKITLCLLHQTGKLAVSTRPAVLDFLPLEMFRGLLSSRKPTQFSTATRSVQTMTFAVSFFPHDKQLLSLKRMPNDNSFRKGIRNLVEKRHSANPSFLKYFTITPFLFLLPSHSQFWKEREMMILQMIEMILFQQAAHQVSHWEVEILRKE